MLRVPLFSPGETDKISQLAASPHFSLFHLNIQSLRNKRQEFDYFINELAPTAIAVTEHWLNKDEVSLYGPENYQLSSASSRNNSKGGGTAIFVKTSTFDTQPLKLEKPIQVEGDFEYCCTTINVPSQQSFLIVCIYRSPSGDINVFLDKLWDLLQQLVRNSSRRVIICGDFNTDFLTNSSSTEAKDVQQLFLSFGLTPHVNEPTRVSKTSKSLIDNFFSNVNDDLVDCTVIKSYLSDHFSQLLRISIEASKSENLHVSIRNFSSLKNNSNFLEAISNQSWSNVYNVPDSKFKFNEFYGTLKYHFDKAHPLCMKPITKKGQKKNPYFKSLSTYI